MFSETDRLCTIVSPFGGAICPKIKIDCRLGYTFYSNEYFSGSQSLFSSISIFKL